MSTTPNLEQLDRQFPPEIIQLIVTASVDSYDVFTAASGDSKPRYSTLKSYCLLNSTWRGISQPQLVKWVAITSRKVEKRFLEYARLRGGMVEGAKDLYINQNDAQDSSMRSKLLGATPKLINFCCGGGTVVLDDLARLHQLRRLALYSGRIIGPLPSSFLSIPKLQHLRLYNVSISTTTVHFLSPTFLPELRYLDVDTSPDVPRLMGPIIRQLEGLQIALAHHHHFLSDASSLRLLSLPPDRLNRLAMLFHLSPLPHFLAMIYGDDEDARLETTDALEDILYSSDFDGRSSSYLPPGRRERRQIGSYGQANRESRYSSGERSGDDICEGSESNGGDTGGGEASGGGRNRASWMMKSGLIELRESGGRRWACGGRGNSARGSNRVIEVARQCEGSMR